MAGLSYALLSSAPLVFTPKAYFGVKNYLKCFIVKLDLKFPTYVCLIHEVSLWVATAVTNKRITDSE